MVYVYANDSGKTKLLWAFGTGDRAEGGLKEVYAENGELVLELFGDNRFEDGEWKFGMAKGKFSGLCCQRTYNKFRFKRNGEKFVLKKTPELFDYDWRKQQIAK